MTVAILVLAATLWGIAATAGSLRNGGGSPAQVSGSLPGPVLWTYYQTSVAPEITTFAAAGGGDNILTLINPNGSANANIEGGASNTCAMIYVFDDDQEMGECCGCPITPAGLETFSVERDLTSNWGIRGAEGNDNSNGSIAIVAVGTNVPFTPAGPLSNGLFCPKGQSAACNAGCDPTNRPGYSVSTATNLLGSIVHNQDIRTGSGMVSLQSGLTEAPLFDNGSGDPSNLTYLQAQCGALVGNGTGGGICRCQVPDPNAVPSPHITVRATSTPTHTATATASATSTPTRTATSTRTSTPTPTATPTATATATATTTATSTATATTTPTPTPTPTPGPAFACPSLIDGTFAGTICLFTPDGGQSTSRCNYDTNGDLIPPGPSCPSTLFSGGFCATLDNSGELFIALGCTYSTPSLQCNYDVSGNVTSTSPAGCPTNAVSPPTPTPTATATPTCMINNTTTGGCLDCSTADSRSNCSALCLTACGGIIAHNFCADASTCHCECGT